MIRPIILITTCVYHQARNEQCRRTWLKEWGELVDYRFVFGAGYSPKNDDEISFPVDDSYQGLPAKIQASHKWAYDQGFNFILKTDCDMYVHIPRLLRSGFEQHSYVGNLFWPDAPHKFVLGAAYWLDKKATEILVNAPLPPYPADGGDDLWVGRVMERNQIPIHHDGRYYIGNEIPWDSVITVHTSGPPPISMAEVHNRIG